MNELYIVSGETYERMGGGDLFLEVLHSEEDVIAYLKERMALGEYVVRDKKNNYEEVLDREEYEKLKNKSKYKITRINNMKEVKKICDEINGDGWDYIQVYKILFGGLRKIQLI